MANSPMVRQIGNLAWNGKHNHDRNEAHHQYGGWRHKSEYRVFLSLSAFILTAALFFCFFWTNLQPRYKVILTFVK